MSDSFKTAPSLASDTVVMDLRVEIVTLGVPDLASAHGRSMKRLSRLLSESPLEALRHRATRGLQVRASRQEVARGEQFDAVVTVSEPNLADLEVGVVCTGYFAAQTYGEHGPTRTTSQAILYEGWLPTEPVVGVQTVLFQVPAKAPFSYDGDVVSFKWEVVARGRRQRRLDARATDRLWVLP